MIDLRSYSLITVIIVVSIIVSKNLDTVKVKSFQIPHVKTRDQNPNANHDGLFSVPIPKGKFSINIGFHYCSIGGYAAVYMMKNGTKHIGGVHELQSPRGWGNDCSEHYMMANLDYDTDGELHILGVYTSKLIINDVRGILIPINDGELSITGEIKKAKETLDELKRQLNDFIN